jgi:hypothetical protein
MEPYAFATADVRASYQRPEDATAFLVSLVRSGKIWFPFQRYFRGNPRTLFENIKHIELATTVGDYHLYSYYPTHGSYLPPRFRKRPVILEGGRNTYIEADVLSDHFIEHIRLKSRRYDQTRSILECWMDDACLGDIMKHVLTKENITPLTIRESIYETIAETKIFNPTWAKGLVKLVMGPNLAGKKWLDISAGWGDRLLTAMALDMDYLGFDPNNELQPGHTDMINMFGDSKRHRVVYQPFETAVITGGPYDVVMSSPPYFNVETYAPNQPGQSIVSYPDYTSWMINFLFVALQKAWDNLKIDGYLILHLGDTKIIKLCEPTNIFIGNYLAGASWEGVIGLRGEAGYPRPVWVWKKVPLGFPVERWEPSNKKNGGYNSFSTQKRTLFTFYPNLHNEWINYQASIIAPTFSVKHKSVATLRQYITKAVPQLEDLAIYSVLEVAKLEGTVSFMQDVATRNLNANQIDALLKQLAPFYETRKNNAKAIRDHVSIALPQAPRSTIDNILEDDLLISTLLEVIPITDTITWATNAVKDSI